MGIVDYTTPFIPKPPTCLRCSKEYKEKSPEAGICLRCSEICEKLRVMFRAMKKKYGPKVIIIEGNDV